MFISSSTFDFDIRLAFAKYSPPPAENPLWNTFYVYLSSSVIQFSKTGSLCYSENIKTLTMISAVREKSRHSVK
jgi:hypothetical protein